MCPPETIIGLKLVTPFELKHNREGQPFTPITGLPTFIQQIFNSMIYQVDNLGDDKDGDKSKERTICINTYDYSATDFELADSDKDKLIQSGYWSAHQFFNKEFLKLVSEWSGKKN